MKARYDSRGACIRYGSDSSYVRQSDADNRISNGMLPSHILFWSSAVCVDDRGITVVRFGYVVSRNTFDADGAWFSVEKRLVSVYGFLGG